MDDKPSRLNNSSLNHHEPDDHTERSNSPWLSALKAKAEAVFEKFSSCINKKPSQDPDKKTIALKPGVQFTLLVLFVVVLGLPLGFLLCRNTGLKTSAGLAYLDQQEHLAFNEIYDKIQAVSKALDPEIVENPDTMFSCFNNSVIMGDSRAAGFKEYGYLPSSHVLAEIGAPISSIADYTNTIQDMQPKFIFLTYGLNNMDPGKEHAYTKETLDLYESSVQKLQEVSPNSTIILCAILPVTEGAAAANPAYAYLDDFNQDLKDMACRNGWLFDDGSDLDLEGHPEWYEPDGEHFIGEFYIDWARNMLNSVLVHQSLNRTQQASENPEGKQESSATNEDQQAAELQEQPEAQEPEDQESQSETNPESDPEQE